MTWLPVFINYQLWKTKLAKRYKMQNFFPYFMDCISVFEIYLLQFSRCQIKKATSDRKVLCIHILSVIKFCSLKKKLSSTCKSNKSNVTYTCFIKGLLYEGIWGNLVPISTCMVCPLRCSFTSNCCLVISNFALEHKLVWHER